MNRPREMYKIQPLFAYPETIERPKCMYEMPTIYDSAKVTISKTDENLPAPEVDLVKLEDRQKLLIRQLEDLTIRLQQIKQQMTMIPPVAKQSSPERTAPEFLLQDGDVIDVVITASPAHKPVAVMVLANWLKEQYRTAVSCYAHSSVTNQRPHQQSMLQKVPRDEPRSQQQILVTLIWKDVGDDPWLATKQTAISGEVNIARYLSSFLSPVYQFCDPVRQTEVDAWLDLAHLAVVHGGNKERQATLHTLNAHLEKAKFLVGGVLSLADVGMLSAVLQTQSASSLPAGVKKWLALCCQNPGIAAALDALSISAS